jgi:hypothetical protein
MKFLMRIFRIPYSHLLLGNMLCVACKNERENKIFKLSFTYLYNTLIKGIY